VSNGLPTNLKEIRRQIHQTIAKVADDYGRRKQFNTAVAAVMELMNALGKLDGSNAVARGVIQEGLEMTVLMLAPIIPHACEMLWTELRPGTKLLDQPWPMADANAMEQSEIELVVQVNGKLRGNIRVAKEADKAAIEAAALANADVQKHVAGLPPKKVIVVPGRLVNIVV
jgi:leucyl-tRNA synthetase